VSDDHDDHDDIAVDGDEVDEQDEAADPNRVPAATAREVCDFLVRALVRDPDAVRVEVVEGHRKGPRLDVYVAQGDMGRVIGKRGRTASAIRTVVRAAAVRDDVDVAVEFVD
jgi:predicted RNA-binding protein YlqC (UPF0109 family)